MMPVFAASTYMVGVGRRGMQWGLILGRECAWAGSVRL